MVHSLFYDLEVVGSKPHPTSGSQVHFFKAGLLGIIADKRASHCPAAAPLENTQGC